MRFQHMRQKSRVNQPLPTETNPFSNSNYLPPSYSYSSRESCPILKKLTLSKTQLSQLHFRYENNHPNTPKVLAIHSPKPTYMPLKEEFNITLELESLPLTIKAIENTKRRCPKFLGQRFPEIINTIQYLCNRYGAFRLTKSMIGWNQMKHIKIWIHQEFHCCYRLYPLKSPDDMAQSFCETFQEVLPFSDKIKTWKQLVEKFTRQTKENEDQERFKKKNRKYIDSHVQSQQFTEPSQKTYSCHIFDPIANQFPGTQVPQKTASRESSKRTRHPSVLVSSQITTTTTVTTTIISKGGHERTVVSRGSHERTITQPCTQQASKGEFKKRNHTQNREKRAHKSEQQQKKPENNCLFKQKLKKPPKTGMFPFVSKKSGTLSKQLPDQAFRNTAETVNLSEHTFLSSNNFPKNPPIQELLSPLSQSQSDIDIELEQEVAAIFQQSNYEESLNYTQLKIELETLF